VDEASEGIGIEKRFEALARQTKVGSIQTVASETASLEQVAAATESWPLASLRGGTGPGKEASRLREVSFPGGLLTGR
jgi:hypothetical protein